MKKRLVITLALLFLAVPASAEVLSPGIESTHPDKPPGTYGTSGDVTGMSAGPEWMMVAADSHRIGQLEKAGVVNETAEPFPRQPHRIGLALNYYYCDYKEELTSPLKSTEKEWITALRFYYNYFANDSGYILLFAETSVVDDTDYDGSTQTGIPLKQTTENDFRKVELDLGYTFKGGLPFSFTPYVGIGYRYWMRDLGSLKEDYSWFYIPLGLRVTWAPHQQFSMALNASVNFMFDGEMTVYDWTGASNVADTTVQLDDKPGYLVELPITFNLARHWAIALIPWYEYSKIGQSPYEPIFYKDGTYTGFVLREPSSRTHQYGLRAGVEFVF